MQSCRWRIGRELRGPRPGDTIANDLQDLRDFVAALSRE